MTAGSDLKRDKRGCRTLLTWRETETMATVVDVLVRAQESRNMSAPMVRQAQKSVHGVSKRRDPSILSIAPWLSSKLNRIDPSTRTTRMKHICSWMDYLLKHIENGVMV